MLSKLFLFWKTATRQMTSFSFKSGTILMFDPCKDANPTRLLIISVIHHKWDFLNSCVKRNSIGSSLSNIYTSSVFTYVKHLNLISTSNCVRVPGTRQMLKEHPFFNYYFQTKMRPDATSRFHERTILLCCSVRATGCNANVPLCKD